MVHFHNKKNSPERIPDPDREKYHDRNPVDAESFSSMNFSEFCAVRAASLEIALDFGVSPPRLVLVGSTAVQRADSNSDIDIDCHVPVNHPFLTNGSLWQSYCTRLSQSSTKFLDLKLIPYLPGALLEHDLSTGRSKFTSMGDIDRAQQSSRTEKRSSDF